MGKFIEVSTDAGSVKVKKLPLKDYGTLLKTVQGMPEVVGKFLDENDADDFKDTSKMLNQLPDIIIEFMPEVAKLLSVLDDKSPDFHMEELGLDENVRIIVAALEVNNFQEIVENIKKMMPPKSPVANPVPNSNPEA